MPPDAPGRARRRSTAGSRSWWSTEPRLAGPRVRRASTTRGGARRAAEHLLALGHRRFAVLCRAGRCTASASPATARRSTRRAPTGRGASCRRRWPARRRARPRMPGRQRPARARRARCGPRRGAARAGGPVRDGLELAAVARDDDRRPGRGASAVRLLPPPPTIGDPAIDSLGGARRPRAACPRQRLPRADARGRRRARQPPPASPSRAFRQLRPAMVDPPMGRGRASWPEGPCRQGLTSSPAGAARPREPFSGPWSMYSAAEGAHRVEHLVVHLRAGERVAPRRRGDRRVHVRGVLEQQHVVAVLCSASSASSCATVSAGVPGLYWTSMRPCSSVWTSLPSSGVSPAA